MEDWMIWVASLSVAFLAVKLAFLCLRIKSTKKTPELLGTAGTVKVIGATDSQDSLQVCLQFTQTQYVWFMSNWPKIGMEYIVYLHFTTYYKDMYNFVHM